MVAPNKNKKMNNMSGDMGSVPDPKKTMGQVVAKEHLYGTIKTEVTSLLGSCKNKQATQSCTNWMYACIRNDD